MAENVENIESKLCAYVDGQLAGAEREEIERHLDANPAHRGLIEELRRQRFFVRGLPREKAPADLLENLQSQLERSALLDGEELTAPAPILRIGRWPQVFSAAAIILLTTGVAFVVYTMLPPRGVSPELAFNPELKSSHPRDGGASKDLAGGADRVLLKGNSDGNPDGNLDEPAVSQAAANGALGARQKSVERLAEFFSQQGDTDTMVITVRADDPRVAGAQVAGYFKTNAIAYAEAPDQVAALGALRQALGETRSDAPALGVPQKPAENRPVDSFEKSFDKLQDDHAQTDEKRIAAKRALDGRPEARQGVAAKPEATPPAAARPSVAKDEATQDAPAIAGFRGGDPSASRLAIRPEDKMKGAPAPPGNAAGQVYVARGLSQSQVDELTAALPAASGYRTSLRRNVVAAPAPTGRTTAKSGAAQFPGEQPAGDVVSKELRESLADSAHLLRARTSPRPLEEHADASLEQLNELGKVREGIETAKRNAASNEQAVEMERFAEQSFGRSVRSFNAVIIVTPPAANPAPTATPASVETPKSNPATQRAP